MGLYTLQYDEPLKNGYRETRRRLVALVASARARFGRTKHHSRADRVEDAALRR